MRKFAIPYFVNRASKITFKPDFQPRKPAKTFFRADFTIKSRCDIISPKILEESL